MFLKKASLLLIGTLSLSTLASFSLSKQVTPSGYGQTCIVSEPVQPVHPKQHGYSNLFVAPPPPQPQPLPVTPLPTRQPMIVTQPYQKVVKEYTYQTKQKTKLAKYVDRDRYIWFYDKHHKHTYFL